MSDLRGECWSFTALPFAPRVHQWLAWYARANFMLWDQWSTFKTLMPEHPRGQRHCLFSAANRAELISEGVTKYHCKLFKHMTVGPCYLQLGMHATHMVSRNMWTGKRLSLRSCLIVWKAKHGACYVQSKCERVFNASEAEMICFTLYTFKVSSRRDWYICVSICLCMQAYSAYGYIKTECDSLWI